MQIKMENEKYNQSTRVCTIAAPGVAGHRCLSTEPLPCRIMGGIAISPAASITVVYCSGSRSGRFTGARFRAAASAEPADPISVAAASDAATDARSVVHPPAAAVSHPACTFRRPRSPPPIRIVRVKLVHTASVVFFPYAVAPRRARVAVVAEVGDTIRIRFRNDPSTIATRQRSLSTLSNLLRVQFFCMAWHRVRACVW